MGFELYRLIAQKQFILEKKLKTFLTYFNFFIHYVQWSKYFFCLYIENYNSFYSVQKIIPLHEIALRKMVFQTASIT